MQVIRTPPVYDVVIIGSGAGGGTMTIPGCPVRERTHGIERFVEVRGGAYFFLPGIHAIKVLARA